MNRTLTLLNGYQEVGEASKAAVEYNYREYRKELIQVAAVAIAMIECLDRNN